jgi:DNA-directed RNA polymerase I subunit RPA2
VVPIKSTKILPSECRQRGETYKGLLQAKLGWEKNGEPMQPLQISLGEIPVMVKVHNIQISQ